MTALCVRGRASRLALHWLWAALLFIPLLSRAVADEPVVVSIDQASIMKLPERAATVVIGNPLIADLAIQPGGIAVITGKSYGETNFIIMDHTGAVLTEKLVEVKEPIEPTVVVYRGYTRQTYSCTPECSPRITLGDSSKDDIDKETGLPNDYFNRTLSQSVSRSTQAMGAGAGGK
jgi:Pilus formation protein N terminal region